MHKCHKNIFYFEKDTACLWRWDSQGLQLISCEVVEVSLFEICQEVVTTVVKCVAHNACEFREMIQVCVFYAFMCGSVHLVVLYIHLRFVSESRLGMARKAPRVYNLRRHSLLGTLRHLSFLPHLNPSPPCG